MPWNYSYAADLTQTAGWHGIRVKKRSSQQKRMRNKPRLFRGVCTQTGRRDRGPWERTSLVFAKNKLNFCQITIPLYIDYAGFFLHPGRVGFLVYVFSNSNSDTTYV